MNEHHPRCSVCRTPIEAHATAQVVGGNFGADLRALYKNEVGGDFDADDIRAESVARVRDGDVAPYVDAVTSAYFSQFRTFYAPEDDDGGVDGLIVNADDATAFLRLSADPNARLLETLRRYPETKDLWLLVHHDCLPEEEHGYRYEIALSRIATAEMGLAWTMHLAMKKQWNAVGWVALLVQLFGRITV